MPESFIRQAVPRSSNVWYGDVWKNIVESRTIKEIDTYVCFADQGIGVILKRPNKNLLKLNIENFKNLKFQDYYYNYNYYLNIIDVKKLNILF